MKVLWLTANFHPEIGGMQTYTDRLVENLAAWNRVALVTTAGQWIPHETRVEHRVCPGLGGSRFRWRWERARERLRRICTELAPDIVHWANAGMAVYHDVMPPGAALVASVHATDLTQPWQLAPGRDVQSEIRLGLSRCRRVIAVSRHTAGLVRQRGIAAEVRVILNSCDLQTFHPVALDREAFLRARGVPPEGLVLLTVARLAERKGHAVVAEALAGLDRPFHWVVVGEGEHARQVRRRIKALGLRPRVSFLSRLSQEELLGLYNACDVFVLAPVEVRRQRTSDSEGFGVAFHEAGACGRPVLASDVSGCREAVLHERTGLLVPPGDAAALRASLERLADEPELRRELGRAGLEHARAQGGWERVAREVQEVYRELSEPSRP